MQPLTTAQLPSSWGLQQFLQLTVVAYLVALALQSYPANGFAQINLVQVRPQPNSIYGAHTWQSLSIARALNNLWEGGHWVASI